MTILTADQAAAEIRARTTTRTVAELEDGDVFSADHGATWHRCFAPLWGDVSCYLPGSDTLNYRVPADRDAVVLVAVPDDEPTDAGPLVCAECGTSRARTYVVTFLGGDQDDPTGRTEVCQPCEDVLTHGEPEDETVDRTGRPYPRGRCDTCGAPCTDDDGECTRDSGHAVALDVDQAERVWMDRLAAQTDAEAAAEGWVAAPEHA